MTTQFCIAKNIFLVALLGLMSLHLHTRLTSSAVIINPRSISLVMPTSTTAAAPSSTSVTPDQPENLTLASPESQTATAPGQPQIPAQAREELEQIQRQVSQAQAQLYYWIQRWLKS